MESKCSLSEEMSTLLRQLVANHHMRMAGLVLHTYFRRNCKLDDGLATHYVVRYFRKYYPVQLQKYQNRQGKAC